MPMYWFVTVLFRAREGVSVWLSKSDGFVFGSVCWLSLFLGYYSTTECLFCSIRVSCARELWKASTLNFPILVTKMVYELDL